MEICDCAVIVDGVWAASISTAGSSNPDTIFRVICGISSLKSVACATASVLNTPSAAELNVMGTYHHYI
jgi:hypothetical protein